jgi:predicted Holliday junction resolvase-like endonuclease
MRLFTLLLILILTATGAVASLNWGAFVVPVDLSIGFAIIRMPIGLLMLAVLVVVTVLFLLYVVYMQTSSLLETRRLSRKLEANIALAEKAEASRFTELRSVLESEIAKQASREAESRTVLLNRVDQLSKELNVSLGQATNTLAAHIGEFEDRFVKTTMPVKLG